MGTQIQILSPELIGHIAAGEVVERPASIVKELVENSIDAKASEVRVDIARGGKECISVIDDGRGMSLEDAHLCLERHATSKISRLEDLEQISSLGFRGEALPSISAISRLTIETKENDSLDGSFVSCAGGKIVEARSAGCPKGTKVCVSDIFYNTPARKKFLRGDKTEEGHIIDIISRLALAYPAIRWFLTSDGKEKLACLSISKPKERLKEIFGGGVGDNAKWFEEASSGIKISGFLGEPRTATNFIEGIYLFVNGRFVKDRVINHAVTEGYRSLIPFGRQPFAVVYLSIDPKLVDVNVHPAKQEVRFENSGAVHNFVAAAVKKGLRDPCWSLPPNGLFGGRNDSASVACREPAEGLPYDSSGYDQVMGFFSSLRIIGQFAGTFILCESSGKKFIAVDQHAAHERIGFERLKKELFAGRVIEQRLLLPEQVELLPKDLAYIIEHLKLLEKLGLELEPFGGNTLIIKSVPALLSDTDIKPLITKLARELSEFSGSASAEEKAEEILKSIACHKQIRAHHKLSEPEMRSLLMQMDEWPNTFTCPHGRPTYIEYTEEEVNKWFKRT